VGREPIQLLSCLAILLSTQALAGCQTGAEKRALADYDRLKYRVGEAAHSGDDTQQNPLSIGDNPTLEEYLKLAAANSPKLRAAYERWTAAVQRMPQVRALANPQLHYGFFLEEVETRVGPQRHRVGISQQIPWLSKLSLNSDMAAMKAHIERRRFENKAQELFYQVKVAYFNLYDLKKSIDITRDAISLVQYSERVARSRFRTTKGKQNDTIRAQIELGIIEERLTSLIDQRRPFNAVLNSLLNRSSDDFIPWPKSLPKIQLPTDEEELFANLRHSNSELEIISAEIDRSQKVIERAKKDYFPDFKIGVDYIETGSARASRTRGNGRDPIIASFAISIPLWQSKYDAALRQARAQKRASQARARALARALEAKLHRALFDLRESSRKQNLYGKTLIPKAQQAQRSTMKSFEAGTSDFLSLIDTQRSLLEFQLNYEKSKTDYARTAACIERLISSAVKGKSP
jgi:outer membrane protein, heavy metal efflux system